MILTPRTKNGERITIRIEERSIPRGRRWSRVVTEQKTGKKFIARGASCGVPGCFCDAIVEEVKE